MATRSPNPSSLSSLSFFHTDRLHCSQGRLVFAQACLITSPLLSPAVPSTALRVKSEPEQEDHTAARHQLLPALQAPWFLVLRPQHRAEMLKRPFSPSVPTAWTSPCSSLALVCRPQLQGPLLREPSSLSLPGAATEFTEDRQGARTAPTDCLPVKLREIPGQGCDCLPGIHGPEGHHASEDLLNGPAPLCEGQHDSS